MANSDNNTDSKPPAAKNCKLNRIACSFGTIGIVLGALFWVLESAIHAFLFDEGTFTQQLTNPSANELWMRLVTVSLFAGFGKYVGSAMSRLMKTSERLRASNQQLGASKQQLNAANQQLRAGKEDLTQTNHRLGKRVKELNCLYGLSRLAERDDIALEDIIQELAELIPPSWQYPEITAARITFEGRQFETCNFRKTAWIQSADIMVHDQKAGSIEICYLKKMLVIDEGPFLKEERSLLNALAERMGSIIDRKQAEEQTRKHQTEFAHASRLSLMGQTASELAHEINQPLCAIMGRAESSLRTAKSIEPKNDDLVDQIETIVKQTERAGKIVSRIKHFATKDTNVRSTVYVNEVVGEALGIIGQEIKSSGVKINMDLGDTKPIQADPVQIEQVVLNLIQNGIEALQKTHRSQRALTISTKNLGSMVEVAITDSGTGISKEDLENVFESFFTTKKKGLGIGLSICRSIIESHGGSLNFRDNSASGVSFYFTLPINTITTVAKH